MFDEQLDFFSSIFSDKEGLSAFVSSGIDASFFKDKAATTYLFIKDFIEDYNKLPPVKEVERILGESLIKTEAPVAFYIQKLQDLSAKQTIYHSFSKTNLKLENNDLNGALDSLEECLHLARSRSRSTIQIHPFSQSETQLRDHLENVNKGHLNGYQFPWQHFTQETQGLKPNEYAIIAARPGIGKTWLAIQIANSIWTSKGKVLFVSMEMDPKVINMRHYSYMTGIPYKNLFRGILTDEEKSRLLNTAKVLSQSNEVKEFDIVGFNMVGKLSDIERAINQTKPDVLIVDGAYLLNPSNSERMSRNEKMEIVSKYMAEVATKHKIAVVNTLQLNREQKRKDVGSDISYFYGSDSWVQNADYAFSMTQDDNDRFLNQMRISLLKHRNGNIFASRMNWDLDLMNFDMIEFEVGKLSLDKSDTVQSKGVSW